MKKFNKILSGIAITGMLAASTVGLVGCGGNSPQGDFNSATEIYGFAGITTSMLATSETTAAVNELVNKAVVSKGLTAESDNNDIKQKLENAFTQTLDNYMGLFDAVVGGTKPVDVVDGESDKNEYAHKLTVKVTSIDGNENVCVMYFNETLKDGGAAVVDSDEEEKETELNGIMYFNNSPVPLTLKGSKEIDPKNKEVELSFEAGIDANNKVVFEQECEVKNGKLEQEYSFELVANGHSVYQFGFEIEKKNNKIEVEYSQEVAGVEINFEIEKESDNIVIETTDFFGIELKINVTIQKDETVQHYVYSVPILNLTFNGAPTQITE